MKHGLRTQILFLALFPPLLVALALGLYLGYTRSQDIQMYLEDRAHALILQLEINSQSGFPQGNHELLQRLANASLEENGIRAVSFLDTQGGVIAHAGPQLKMAIPKHALEKDSVFHTANGAFHTWLAPIHKAGFTSLLTPPDHTDTNPLLGWVAIEYDIDNIILRQHQQYLIQAFLTFLALFISGMSGFFLAQRLVRDIHSLNNNIKKIREDEPIELPPMTSSSEMASLSHNIGDMASHFKAEFDDMRHNLEVSANDLKETIETIEIQNIELTLAKKEALSASKSKSEFLANTSHEIRTPLNGIIGFTRILGKTPLSNQQKEYVETIQQSSESLLSIINDVLDFSKIEAGKLELELAPLNIRHVLEECITLFAPHAYEKHVEMVLMIYQDVPLHIIGDSLRIKQIISNLLSNAVKFTHAGTIVIRVSLEHSDNEYAELGISVADTGIGMTAEQQKNIFQSFTQANSSISREYGGTGLGLAIAQKLVELMSDEIRVESAPDEGSTFSFMLRTKLVEQNDPSPYRHLANKTVLLVEEHELLSLSLKHMLASWGMIVISSDTPDKATRILNEYHADIILLGIHARKDSKAYKTQADAGHENITNSNKEYIGNISLLEKLSIPLLLLSSSVSEDMLDDEACRHLPVIFKPVTEDRLYHGIYQRLYPQKQSTLGIFSQGMIKTAPRPLLNILVVDDQPANLKLLNVLLTDLGMEVTDASNGQEAVELCRNNQFDLVFMDIQMPVMNGINATMAIRDMNTYYSSVPVIAVTAHAMADEREAILKAGMNDYITKPVNEEHIQSILKKWCQKEETEFGIEESDVDVDQCLRLANFKPDLAMDMFSMLLETLPVEINEIRKCMEEENRDNLLEMVHKLHGACCYTGVPALKSASQRLEYAIKNDDKCSWESLLEELCKAAEGVINWHQRHNISLLLQPE